MKKPPLTPAMRALLVLVSARVVAMLLLLLLVIVVLYRWSRSYVVVTDPQRSVSYRDEAHRPFTAIGNVPQFTVVGANGAVLARDRETAEWTTFELPGVARGAVAQILHAEDIHRVFARTEAGGVWSADERLRLWKAVRDDTTCPVPAESLTAGTKLGDRWLVFGTPSAGLALYDTTRGSWQQFRAGDTTPGTNAVTDLLYLESKHILLVGTAMGVERYVVDPAADRPLARRLFAASPELPEGKILRFEPQGLAAPDEPVFCLTEDGAVHRFTGDDGWQRIIGGHGFAGEKIPRPRLCRVDARHSLLLVADETAGWHVYDWRVRDWLQPDKESAKVYDMTQWEGRWWIATELGVRIFDPETRRLESVAAMPEAVRTSAVVRLQAGDQRLLGLTADGGLWACGSRDQWNWLISDVPAMGDTLGLKPLRIRVAGEWLWIACADARVLRYHRKQRELALANRGLEPTTVADSDEIIPWVLTAFELAGDRAWCVRSRKAEAPGDLCVFEGEQWVMKARNVRKIAPFRDGLLALTTDESLLFFSNSSGDQTFFGGSAVARESEVAIVAAVDWQEKLFVVLEKGRRTIRVYDTTLHSWTEEVVPFGEIVELQVRQSLPDEPPGRPRLLAVTSRGGLFMREAGGGEWTAIVAEGLVNPGAKDLTPVSACATPGREILVVTAVGTVHLFDPLSGSWTPVAHDNRNIRDVADVGGQPWMCDENGQVFTVNDANLVQLRLLGEGLGPEAGQPVLVIDAGGDQVWVITSGGKVGQYDCRTHRWNSWSLAGSAPFAILKWGLIAGEPPVAWVATSRGSFTLGIDGYSPLREGVTLSGLSLARGAYHAWASTSSGTEFFSMEQSGFMGVRSGSPPLLPGVSVRGVGKFAGSLTATTDDGQVFRWSGTGDWELLAAVIRQKLAPIAIASSWLLVISLVALAIAAWREWRNGHRGCDRRVMAVFLALLVAWSGIFSTPTVLAWWAATRAPSSAESSGKNDLLAWKFNTSGMARFVTIDARDTPLVLDERGRFAFDVVHRIENGSRGLELHTPAGTWNCTMPKTPPENFANFEARFRKPGPLAPRLIKEDAWLWRIRPELRQIEVVAQHDERTPRRFEGTQWADLFVTSLYDLAVPSDVVRMREGTRQLTPHGYAQHFRFGGQPMPSTPKLRWQANGLDWISEGKELRVARGGQQIEWQKKGTRTALACDFISDFGVAPDDSLWVRSDTGLQRYTVSPAGRLMLDSGAEPSAAPTFTIPESPVHFDGITWHADASGFLAARYDGLASLPEAPIVRGRFAHDMVSDFQVRDGLVRLATPLGMVEYPAGQDGLETCAIQQQPPAEYGVFEIRHTACFDGTKWEEADPKQNQLLALAGHDSSHPIAWRSTKGSWKFAFDFATRICAGASELELATEGGGAVFDFAKGVLRFAQRDARERPRKLLLFDQISSWTLHDREIGEAGVLFSRGEGQVRTPVRFHAGKFPWDSALDFFSSPGGLWVETPVGLVDLSKGWQLSTSVRVAKPWPATPPPGKKSELEAQFGKLVGYDTFGRWDWFLFRDRIVIAEP